MSKESVAVVKDNHVVGRIATVLNAEVGVIRTALLVMNRHERRRLIALVVKWYRADAKVREALANFRTQGES